MPRIIDNLIHFNGKGDESSTTGRRSTPASSNRMGLVNLRDLVESVAHKWYKDNE
ncbi:unnamed protein product, partial [Rotaria sordida]